MNFEDWGEIDFEEALQRQLDYVSMISEGDEEELIAFATHAPVLALGQGVQDCELHGWTGKKVSIQTAGKVSYFGSSQLCIYPLLDLNKRNRNLSQFINSLEKQVSEALKEFDVHSSTPEGQRGLWIQGKKIASFNIAIKKWVSYHGISIQVDKDTDSIYNLTSCNGKKEEVVSIEEILGGRLKKSELVLVLKSYLSKV